MTPKKYQISANHIPQLTTAIQNNIKDEQIKTLFLDFFKSKYVSTPFLLSERTRVHNHFEECIITLFSDYTIELFSWKRYCIDMKVISQQKWNEKNVTEINGTRRMARILLSDFYIYVIENTDIDTEGIVELREHQKFLIHQERPSSKMNDILSEHLLDRIGTNFPIGSSLSELHFIPGEKLPIILNLNVQNKEIKNLLVEFYFSQYDGKQYNGLRLFVYLFKYSLFALESSPQSITDFTFNVFKKQYRFYQKANVLNVTTQREMKLQTQLIRFYSFLCKKIKELDIQHNIFEGTLYNEHLFSSNNFAHFYEKGYELLKHNPFEPVPSEDKWLLMISDNYSSASNGGNRGIDFTQIKDKSLRDDLKNFAWKQSSMTSFSLTTSIHILIELLNFIANYKKRNEIQGNNYVDAKLLEQWSFYISGKKPETGNSYIHMSRAYLKFCKEKYRIPNALIDILSQTPRDKDGGTPMTKKDFDLFTQKFKEESLKNVTGELSYIIYNLAATTKLRPGEVINLERNCVVKKFEQTGVIEYYSKTSGSKKVEATLPIEKINLIEKAILLTNDAHVKSHDDIAKFVFVKEDSSKKDRIIHMKKQFQYTFSKFQKELEGQLDNVYRPYSLRTTFIDNIYTEGLKDGLPTSVMAEMAGNTVQTAVKYYRNATATQQYAEAFAGVTISGVDVYGNIIEDDAVENLNPVEEGLGGCELVGCVVDDDEYKCLMCSYFATTPSKIPLFKEKIARLKTIKESTLNDQERNIIEAELKLYTAYYAKLLEQIGDD